MAYGCQARSFLFSFFGQLASLVGASASEGLCNQLHEAAQAVAVGGRNRMAGGRPSGEQFLKHADGFQLGQSGQVQTVIVEDDLQATVALVVIHGKEVHGVEVHTHEVADGFRLVGRKNGGMRRSLMNKAGVVQVEPIAVLVILCVGPQTDET